MRSPNLLRQLRQGSPAQLKANPNIGSSLFGNQTLGKLGLDFFKLVYCLITTQISLFSNLLYRTFLKLLFSLSFIPKAGLYNTNAKRFIIFWTLDIYYMGRLSHNHTHAKNITKSRKLTTTITNNNNDKVMLMG